MWKDGIQTVHVRPDYTSPFKWLPIDIAYEFRMPLLIYVQEKLYVSLECRY